MLSLTASADCDIMGSSGLKCFEGEVQSTNDCPRFGFEGMELTHEARTRPGVFGRGRFSLARQRYLNTDAGEYNSILPSCSKEKVP